MQQAYSLCVSYADIGVKGRIQPPDPDEIQILGAADKYDMAALDGIFGELNTPKSLISDISVATSQSGSSSTDDNGLHYAGSIRSTG